MSFCNINTSFYSLFPAPDVPDFLSQYPMAEGTDFAQQTRAIYVIDDLIITEERTLTCYNQLIYDDPCLEPDEYAGLTLGVIDYDRYKGHTTVKTIVEPLCDQAAILIVDNDSEFVFSSALHWMAMMCNEHMHMTIDILQEL